MIMIASEWVLIMFILLAILVFLIFGFIVYIKFGKNLVLFVKILYFLPSINMYIGHQTIAL